MEICEDLLRERRAIQERLHKLEKNVDGALGEGKKHNVDMSFKGGREAGRGSSESEVDIDSIISDINVLASNLDGLTGKEQTTLRRIREVLEDQDGIRRANKRLAIAIIFGVVLVSGALALGIA